MNADTFYPCDPNDQPPVLANCSRSTPVVTADCDPAGISTISITREGFAYGGNYSGTYTETLTATLGPQTGPPAPAFQPFETSGLQVGSIGFKTGRILTYDADYSISAGGTTITGTKSLVDDLANVGVCREFVDEVSGSTVFGPAPVTGFVYLLEAGNLSYDATITDGTDSTTDSGVAEAYLGDSFLTCCNSASPTGVNSALGHIVQRFGTNHPFAGTTSSAPTPTGSGVAVTPAAGLTLTFGSVTGAGDTQVEMLAPEDVTALPSGFLVGEPPMFYDISTTATFSGQIEVCAPYGAAPAGDTPHLLHLEGGLWIDRTSSYNDTTRVVCGLVSSLSPFAAVFAPAAPQTKDDCKNGKWQTYTSPAFKNQGDCVSWVATHGKNAPKG